MRYWHPLGTHDDAYGYTLACDCGQILTDSIARLSHKEHKEAMNTQYRDVLERHKGCEAARNRGESIIPPDSPFITDLQLMSSVAQGWAKRQAARNRGESIIPSDTQNI